MSNVIATNGTLAMYVYLGIVVEYRYIYKKIVWLCYTSYNCQAWTRHSLSYTIRLERVSKFTTSIGFLWERERERMCVCVEVNALPLCDYKCMINLHLTSMSIL